MRFYFTRCGDLVATSGDTSWLSGEGVSAPALDAYRVEANATYFLADQLRRRDASGSWGGEEQAVDIRPSRVGRLSVPKFSRCVKRLFRLSYAQLPHAMS